MFRPKTRKQKDPSQSYESDHPKDLKPFQAFRTITMMLSLIQTGMDISDIRFNPTQQDRELGQELKILDALAAVCVRNNEIVAVVAAQPDEGSDVTQVIASVTHLNGRKANVNVPQSASSWIDRL